MSIENVVDILIKFDEIYDTVWNKANFHKKVALHAKDNPLFSETIYESGFKIDERYNIILEILLEKPDLNISEINREIQNKNKAFLQDRNSSFNDGEYQKTRRMIKDLTEIKYIHKVTEKGKSIGKFKRVSDIPFRLSISGIFYTIINNLDFYTADLRLFLNNYPNNIPFRYFLYPYFEKTTLQELPYIYPAIVRYLEEVCKLISNNLSWKNSETKLDGYLKYSLFIWNNQDNTPGLTNHDHKWDELRKYLHKELGWNWVHNAKFTPDYFNKTISIDSKEVDPSPILSIGHTDHETVLRHKGKSYHIFNVDKIGNSLNICGKLVPRSDHLNESFNNSLMQNLVLLLLNINTYNNSIVLDKFYELDPGLHNNSKEIKKRLSQDKKFITLTEELIGKLQENIIEKD